MVFLKRLDILQRISFSLLVVLTIVTFAATVLQAVWWQSSEWLVAAVLPATVVTLTNEERKESAVAPLVRNDVLDRAAAFKAKHMAANNYFSHYSPEGVSPWHWFNEAGYVYAHAGENLAIHFTDSSEVVTAWMQSPTHRANMVASKYREIGVGTAKGEYDGYETVYVVQLFGTRANPTSTAQESNSESLEVTELVSATSGAAQTEEIKLQNTAVLPVDSVSESESVAVETVTSSTMSTTDVESLAGVETGSVITFTPHKTVVIQSELMATSSGLPAARATAAPVVHAGATSLASLVTQPGTVLQLIYTVLAVIIVSLLSFSIAIEFRRLRFQQVAYSFLLLCGLGSLWFLHTLLVTGAVIA